jgi:hypothetical protein
MVTEILKILYTGDCILGLQCQSYEGKGIDDSSHFNQYLWIELGIYFHVVEIHLFLLKKSLFMCFSWQETCILFPHVNHMENRQTPLLMNRC